MLTSTAPLMRIYQFRELLLLLVGRDLKVRYKRSVLGMLWTLLNPLLQMVVYTLVFSTIMKIGVPDYPVFLLSGLLPWSLISIGTTGSALSLLSNQGLIRKVAVPQAIYPLSVVGSKLVDLGFSLIPLALLATVLGRPIGWGWLFLIPELVLVTMFTAGLSLFFSSVTVFFRDVRHLIDILFQVWFYLTPVLYPYTQLQSLKHPVLRALLRLNPATPIIRCFQQTIYEGRVPRLATFGAAAFVGVATLLMGYVVFRKSEDSHIHYF